MLPLEAGKTDIRFDLFGTESTVVSSHVIQKWKSRLEGEVATLSSSRAGEPHPFVYECGGKSLMPLSIAEADHVQDDRLSFLLSSISSLG